MKTGDKNWIKIVVKGAEELGVSISDKQAELMALHCTELLEWNRITNLTTIIDPEETALKHVVDSLAIAPMIPEGAAVIDIGTGGGFPGIPLKIARPDLDILLVDSTRKKISFLKNVIARAKLSGIKALQARAEELSSDNEKSGKFDTAVCRAFSDLDTICSMALPLLKKNGCILAMKGREAEKEAAVFNPDFIDKISIKIRQYKLPFKNQERAIIIISKNS